MVFYSWQSDLPNATNRGFIQAALEAAAKTIRDDETVEVEPVIDRDTAGVPGSPDIAATILEKIEKSTVFVCDVSIINSDRGQEQRPTCNPNVLIELGYALKAKGNRQIVMVMNSAFGPPEELPFDLKQKKVISYALPEGTNDRLSERKKLQSILESNLRVIFEHVRQEETAAIVTPPSLSDQARIAVENQAPNREPLVKRYMKRLSDTITALAPDLSKADSAALDQPIIDAINASADDIVRFADLCEAVASASDRDCGLAIYHGFGPILEGYSLPLDFSGTFLRIQHDFHKFVGHELFLIFVGKLLSHERFDFLSEALGERIYVENASLHRGAEAVGIDFIRQHLDSLEHRNDRLKLRRISLHADILTERHGGGDLGRVSPINQLAEADLFLYFRSQFTSEPDESGFRFTLWYPMLAWTLSNLPRFLTKARARKFATRLLPALGVNSIESLRNKLVAAWAWLTRALMEKGWTPRILMSDFKPGSIGSE